MATLSFFPTANTIINASLRLIRGIDPDETPTATQTANGLETFNFLITSWQALGLQIWCQKVSSAITLISGKVTYTVGTGGDINILRPTDISQAWLQDLTSGARQPLNQLSQKEFFLLGNGTTAGTPNSFYYQAAYGTGTEANSGATSKANLWLWTPSDATTVSQKALYLIYTRPFMDFDSSSDAVDMPQEWYNALKWNLAYELAHEYGVPALEIDRLKSRAESTLEMCLGFDSEKTAILMQPDQRLYY